MTVPVKLDELVLKIPGDELRVKFHPRMTVLSGLGAPEREALAQSIVGALAGGAESTALRYHDGLGRLVHALAEPGAPVRARHEDDGSAAPNPVPRGWTASDLRSLMLVRAADLGVVARTVQADEPKELREARTSLQELTAELEAALGEEQAVQVVRAELESIDEQLRAARDNVARREYAEVLAQLEKVRAEAATLQSGTQGVEADRHLLANEEQAWELAERWRAAVQDLADLTARFGDAERLAADDRQAAASFPDQPPADLAGLVAAVVDAHAVRATLDNRLQVLAVAKLPAPSDLLVGELGLIDQDELWHAADRLIAARDDVQRVQVSLGGLGGEEGGPPSAVIEAMEQAHDGLQDAERAAEAVRIPGVAGAALGVAVATAGTLGSPLLIPLGLLITAGVGTMTLVRPKRRVARAAAVERAALAEAGAPSYLGFHLRRVDATVDPNVRRTAEAALAEHRAATLAWVELVGPDVDVHQAKVLQDEAEAYHTALRSLGGAADEIEQIRTELAERAEPAVAAAETALAHACAPFGLTAADLAQPTTVEARVHDVIDRGRAARVQGELEVVEAREQDTARRLGAHLLQLGFDAGELDARLGALEWAVSRAREREEARTNARPSAVIEAELVTLQETARRLKRPEWATVSPSEASLPDITELEQARQELTARLDEMGPASDVDVVRLADRQAALERRVMALEARHGGHDANGDPGAVADIQQHLLARLTQAATAGPHGDPLPAVLDEVFLRIPADRKWDLLDLLFRLSEKHQLIYLTDDPFVAAWASQQASEVTLLAPDAESETV
jgi:hypothetical protein